MPSDRAFIEQPICLFEVEASVVGIVDVGAKIKGKTGGLEIIRTLRIQRWHGRANRRTQVGWDSLNYGSVPYILAFTSLLYGHHRNISSHRAVTYPQCRNTLRELSLGRPA